MLYACVIIKLKIGKTLKCKPSVGSLLPPTGYIHCLVVLSISLYGYVIKHMLQENRDGEFMISAESKFQKEGTYELRLHLQSLNIVCIQTVRRA